MNKQISDKWQAMLAIVNSQQPILLQPSLKWQFKKLVISRWLTENMLAFLFQYAGLLFSTLTNQHFPLWFSSGTACGLVFLRGYGVLPGVWLGNLLAYYFATKNLNLAGISATLFTSQAAFLFWLCYRYISPSLIFVRQLTFIKFTLLSGTLTASCIYLYTLFCFPAVTLQTALHWWLADLNGILIFSCALVAWDTYFPQINDIYKTNKFWLSLLYGSLLFCTMMIIFSHNLTPLFSALATLPLIIIISLYYGWFGAVSAVFLQGLLLSIAASTDTLSPNLSLVALLTLETILGLFLSLARNLDNI